MKKLLLLIGALLGIGLIYQPPKITNTAIPASPVSTVTQSVQTVTPTPLPTQIPTVTLTPTLIINHPSIAPIRNRERNEDN
jgi:hypothetical protein